MHFLKHKKGIVIICFPPVKSFDIQNFNFINPLCVKGKLQSNAETFALNLDGSYFKFQNLQQNINNVVFLF